MDPLKRKVDEAIAQLRKTARLGESPVVTPLEVASLLAIQQKTIERLEREAIQRYEVHIVAPSKEQIENWIKESIGISFPPD